jgi:hypothetical protein
MSSPTSPSQTFRPRPRTPGARRADRPRGPVEAFRDHLLDIVEDVLYARRARRGRDGSRPRARPRAAHGRVRLFKDLSDEELLAIVRGLRLHTYEPATSS